MFYRFARNIIFQFSPEFAHNIAIKYLKLIGSNYKNINFPDNIQQNIWGLDFKSPVGLSAGFDKNAEAIYSLQNQHFGFLEVGTTTPKPQLGNKKPRIFRLIKDEAVINRLGFNNKGVDILLENIKNYNSPIILGINIGKNKDTKNDLDDYKYLLDKTYNSASYITLNISSPNTPGLRNIQQANILQDMMLMIKKFKEKQNIKKPILIKIAPDLNFDQQNDIAQLALHYNIDGLIISNTTITRDNIYDKNQHQDGGLSGKPLFEKSTQILANIYHLTDGQIPIIGVGGISSAADAYKKIKAGASLVQLYTALIYQGLGLVQKINNELAQLVEKDGYQSISEAIGVNNDLYI